MCEIRRDELLRAIVKNVQKTGEDSLTLQEKIECFNEIRLSCQNDTLKKGDQLIDEIEEAAEQAINILESDSPDKAALQSCRDRIINKANR